MTTKWTTRDEEIQTLEACMAECKRRLDFYREQNMELQASLAEADLNSMLENVEQLYERRRKAQECTD